MKTTFREITIDEFQKFTASCPAKNYMQSAPMYERYQTIGRESYLVGLFCDDELMVAGLVSVIYERYKKKIFTFSRGPLMNFSDNVKFFYDFLSQCYDFLRKKQGIILQISPTLFKNQAPTDFNAQLKKIGFKYLGEYEQVKWTYAINFSKNPELPLVKPPTQRSPILSPELSPELEQKLLRSFRRDHRYTIRYATDRYHLKIRELAPKEYDILYRLVNESGKVHGFVPRDVQFFRELKAAFKDDAAAIVVETPEGEPIAAAFYLLYGDEIIYLSSGFTREHKKLGAPHLIQWMMIKNAYANGYRQYNFWGTNPDPENGVHQFKQGFHGELQEFVGTFAAPLTPLGKLYLMKLKSKEQRDL